MTSRARRGRPALVAALACAGLFAAAHRLAAETPATDAAAKSSLAATAKAAGKATKPATKKAASAKSKGNEANKRDNANKGNKSSSHEATAAIPAAGARSAAAPAKRAASHPGDVRRHPPEAPTVALAPTPIPKSSDANVAMVGRAIEIVRSGGVGKATEIEASISDPVARKLVEWIILRSNNGAGSARYAAFIAANPSWPSLATFRRHAEEMLWVEDVTPRQVISFFNGSPPQSAKGRLALARALLAQGDTAGANAQVREAWRNDPMSADVEQQVLRSYPELLSRADDKARMDKRLFAADDEAAMRAAHRLGGADLAVARARIALNGRSGNAGRLLEAVPAEARRDPAYAFAHVQVLRHEKRIAEAAQAMLSAPRDRAEIHDPEEWWVERRVLARDLLEYGDARSAYLVVRDAAEPVKENSRVERLFMAGWIALRFLDDPATAARHFAQIPDVSNHPTSLGRAHYWLGRAAEAAHRGDRARTEYQAAAHSSASYYGQLARARLGFDTLALAPPPERRAGAAGRELVQAVEILYALGERSLIISAMADLGATLDDVGALSALGELAEQHHDARAMLQLGKAAVARGLPLDYYAFPTVSVPQYSPIGPEIDRALLLAIIRQESAFDPSDLSAANAMGLMQVTPVAARDTCKRFGCTFDVRRLKNDTPYNLQLGAAELGGVLQEYRGNYMLAFAGYNAGRGRVKEWIERFGDPRDPKVDPIDWVERIPIMETRNYVQRVMENMQVYRARFGANARLTIDDDLRRGTPGAVSAAR